MPYQRNWSDFCERNWFNRGFNPSFHCCHNSIAADSSRHVVHFDQLNPATFQKSVQQKKWNGCKTEKSWSSNIVGFRFICSWTPYFRIKKTRRAAEHRKQWSPSMRVFRFRWKSIHSIFLYFATWQQLLYQWYQNAYNRMSRMQSHHQRRSLKFLLVVVYSIPPRHPWAIPFQTRCLAALKCHNDNNQQWCKTPKGIFTSYQNDLNKKNLGVQ